MDLQRLVVRLEAETAKYQRDLDAARKKLSAFEKGASASLSKIGAGFAGLVSATAITAFVKKTVEAGDRLDELSQKTGVSVESLSRLGYAASFSGIGVESLADSLGKFAKSSVAAEHGGKAQAAAFNAIGVGVKELVGLSPDEKLLKIAEAFQRLEDGQGKAAVAMALFGKSGADLIPFLNEGPDGIARLAQESDDLGQTMSGDTAKALADFADATDKLFTAISASLRPAVVQLVGPLEEVANVLLDDAKSADIADKDFSVLAATMQTAATAALSLWSGLMLVGDVVGGTIATGISTFLGGMTDGGQSAAAAIDQTATDLEKAVKRFDAIWANRAGAGAKDMGSLNPYDDTVFEGESPLKRGRLNYDPTGGAAADRAAKAIQAKIDALEQEAATLGQTSEQQKLYELRVDGATAAQLAHAKALVTTIGNYELQQEAQEDALKWNEDLDAAAKEYLVTLDQLDGGAQAYGDELAKLSILLDTGRLNQEQYARAAKLAAEKLDTYANAVKEMNLALREDIKNATSDLFQDMITDGKNWKDHLIDYAKKVGDAFAKLSSDMAAQAIFGTTGGKGGFDWGAWAAKALGSLLGSAAGGYSGGGFGSSTGQALADTGISFSGVQLAAGGVMPSNQVALVGERGPELVVSPRVAHVLNHEDTMGALGKGGTTLIQNFAVKDFDSFHASRRQVQRSGKAALGLA